MPKVVISYRRSDSDAIAGRIKDRLASHFGEGSIFMDIDSIPFGTDFRDYIRDALFDSDILVAVVGPKWLGPTEGTHVRIKEENDPIRIEVETALNRGISVIPVLVNGAVMPKPSELPVSLENFAFRNAAEVDAGRDFHPHMDRLIRSIEQILRAKGKPTTSGATGLAAAAASAPSPAQSAPVAVEHRPPEAEPPAHRPEPPPAHVAPAYAAATVATGTGAPGTAPGAMPKRGRSLALVAGSGAAIAAAIAGITVWYFTRPPAPPVKPDQPVIAQPDVPPVPPPPIPSVVPGCPGTPAFHDDFKAVDPGWDIGTKASYSDGQLVIKPEAETFSAVLYPSLIYRNATICLDVKTPPAMNSADYGGGLIFWASDYSNYYRVVITYDGRYQVSRRFNGSFRFITPFTKFDGLKQGYGVVNSIKVTTTGNVATLYLNDRKVQDIKAQPPKAGGSIGLSGTSEKDQANEWRFLKITVVESPTKTVAVPPPDAAVKAMLGACKLGPAAVFADDFKVPDPSWNGLHNENAFYANGLLVIRPRENRIWRVFNLGLVYKNISICADAKSPAQIKNENDTAGGVAFWASAFSNYYVARVYPDGSYSIDRFIDNEKVVPVAPKSISSPVNKGPGAQNRLKVVLKDAVGTNNAVGTLYINDVKVREFRGQPPPEGSSFGLYADSEATSRSEWGFGGIVVTEP